MGLRAAQHVVQSPVLDAKLRSAVNPCPHVQRKLRTGEDADWTGKAKARNQWRVIKALRSPECCIYDESFRAIGRSHRDLDSLRLGTSQRVDFNIQFCGCRRQLSVDRVGQFLSPSFLPFLERVGAVERFKQERSRERIFEREGRTQSAQPS